MSVDITETDNLIIEDAMVGVVESMRNIYQQEGGDAMILGWHITDKNADWTDVVPAEWGFPDGY